MINNIEVKDFSLSYLLIILSKKIILPLYD